MGSPLCQLIPRFLYAVSRFLCYTRNLCCHTSEGSQSGLSMECCFVLHYIRASAPAAKLRISESIASKLSASKLNESLGI